MGRPRSAGRRDLPANLELHSSGIYRYRHPVTDKYHYLSRDKLASVEAAIQLNGMLLTQRSLIDQVVNPSGKSFRQVVEWFRDERLGKLKLATKTRVEKKRMVGVLIGKASGKAIDEMTVLDCAELLAELTGGGRARSIYRTLLVQIFTEAQAEGWTSDNPAARTRDDEPEKQRLPLTLEWFKLIREKATPPIQGAMDLALQTIQRREDISTMPMPRDGRIDFVQHKTGKALSIEVTQEIDAVVQAFKATGVICPFIARAKPLRAKPNDKRAKGRKHFAQIVPEQLSRGFAEARDQLEVFQKMPAPQRPSFHEIRGLGGKLYRDVMGWTEQQVQALMGHSDIEMTREYLGHHAPVYERVTAGLTLKN